VPIVEEKRNARAVERRIRSGLIAYNASKVGAPRYRPLVLSARDANGRLIGGLAGQLYWNVLYIELLWLEEGERTRGLGSRLMQEAEKRARRAVGRIRDYPRGESRIFLIKELKGRR
jgi:GNAT superfamily N-acetyltransferase